MSSSRFLNLLRFGCLFTIIMPIHYCMSMRTSNINGSSSTLCLENERRALLKFKHGLTDTPNRLSSWLGDECCLWSGIVCNNITGHVTKIKLQNPSLLYYSYNAYRQTMLGGKINPSLLDLNYLSHLDLSNNNFNQSRIPNFIGSISSLEYLNLSYSGFSGEVPHQLGNLSRIRCLDIGGDFSSMDLNSDNLEWLLGLKSLRYLDLSMVNLSKAVDWVHVTSSLPSLREFHLRDCSLNDVSLPITSKFNFTALLILDLSYNNLISTIPGLLFSLTRLVSLDISDNHFPSIPSALRNMTSLRVLRSGGIQSIIPEWFYSLNQLEEIDFSNEGLQGELEGVIGNDIGNLTSLINLNLERNNLQGKIPKSLGRLCNLKVIKLSFNHFDNMDIDKILGSFSECIVKRLEMLKMDGCNITGNFPYELGGFTKLSFLSLSDNSISGPISTSVPRLSQLRHLDLSYNQFNGPLLEALGKLELRHLDLSHNQFNGSPLDTLGELELLEYLCISDNMFRGIVTDLHFLNLNRLRYLDISNNQFNGSLPEALGKLELLEILGISGNMFTGIITDLHFVNLSRLWNLDGSGNKLKLKVRDNWIPPFRIGYLYLSSWELGARFPSWLHSQHELLGLHLSNTGISDSIPRWFWENTPELEYLNLSSNQIFGQIPYKRNNFGDRFGFVDLSSNLFSGPLPYDTFSRVRVWLDLSDNSFSGTIHDFLCHDEDRPTTSSINLGNNLLSGSIPDCWKNSENLNVMILDNNNLTGSIPHSLGQVQDLESLHLRNNSLSGELPQELQNCTNLKVLDLSYNKFTGKIPPWVGKWFESLVAFAVRSNRLHGDIPHELCYLSSLQFLDLAQNDLTGLIPSCFHNFTAMSDMKGLSDTQLSYLGAGFESSGNNVVDYGVLVAKGSNYEYQSTLLLLKSMDLSGNKFSGDIPEGLTRLAGLRLLNLSHNHLTGLIPQKIGGLKSLEYLDFSLNHLSGEIPSSMSSLTFLSNLNLSYNNLTGQIPSSTQIQSMDKSAFIGNNLCGPPLLGCRDKKVMANLNQDVQGGGGGEQNEDHWFLGSVALGFVVGFGVVLGPLLFIVSWRMKIFHMLDQFYDIFI